VGNDSDYGPTSRKWRTKDLEINPDRPTTPSWADFLSSGFAGDQSSNPGILLPPSKTIPLPLALRGQSSDDLKEDLTFELPQSAYITHSDLEDGFWWVWMCSLAPEETPERKSAFGHSVVIETQLRGARWMVIEETADSVESLIESERIRV
jgi:hypothetical protein